jgi:hypothetical protein
VVNFRNVRKFGKACHCRRVEFRTGGGKNLSSGKSKQRRRWGTLPQSFLARADEVIE